MFIQPEPKDGESPVESPNAQFVAKNLVNLVNDSKTGELASLEEVVVSLVKDTLDKDKDTVLDPEVFERHVGVRACVRAVNAWVTIWRPAMRIRRKGGCLPCFLDRVGTPLFVADGRYGTC